MEIAMNAHPHVRLENVSVTIPIYSSPLHRSLKHLALKTTTGGLLSTGAGKVPEVQALDGVSLDLGPGTRLGILGHNGAGKTTLLRVIAGILPPTGGRVVTSGKISLMINPAMGMNPEITGREFIDIQSNILGIPADKVAAAKDGIVEFTELGEYIDLPIRTYSTGMQTRLTFSVATAYDADILILDEALGTGDADFQKKASQHFHNWVARAGIVVLASHSAPLVEEICNRVIVLSHGRIVEQG